MADNFSYNEITYFDTRRLEMVKYQEINTNTMHARSLFERFLENSADFRKRYFDKFVSVAFQRVDDIGAFYSNFDSANADFSQVTELLDQIEHEVALLINEFTNIHNVIEAIFDYHSYTSWEYSTWQTTFSDTNKFDNFIKLGHDEIFKSFINECIDVRKDLEDRISYSYESTTMFGTSFQRILTRFNQLESLVLKLIEVLHSIYKRYKQWSYGKETVDDE